MKLGVVIPAYNEAPGIAATLRTVISYLERHHPGAELIVADDGSRDATVRIAEELTAKTNSITARVLALPENRGKGYALRQGMAQTTAELTAFFDADLAYPLDGLEAGAKLIAAGADLALGGRDIDRHSDTRELYRLPRKLATHTFSRVVDWLLGLDVTDTQCGFKMFRGDVARELFAALTIDGFAFDVELIWLARRRHYRIVRFPVAMRRPDRSAVHLVRDSARMLKDIVAIARR